MSQMGASNIEAAPTQWRVELVTKKRGQPPAPTVVTSNPDYDKWVEGAALVLCDDAGECGQIPTPCWKHLSESRRIASHLLTRVTNTVHIEPALGGMQGIPSFDWHEGRNTNLPAGRDMTTEKEA